MSNHRFRVRGHHRHLHKSWRRGLAPWLHRLGRVAVAVTVTALAAILTPLVFAAAGTPGSEGSSGSWVGGRVFTSPFEPLVLWKVPGAGGRLGTCIDANAHGPLRGPYTKHATITDAVYGELNHLYARADTSDVQLAELSALNSHKYDHIDRGMQWSYLVNGRGGTSVAGANAMLARAASLAGPYTVVVSWPAADTATNTPYSATVSVTSASGKPVPGAVVSVSGTNVTLSVHSVTTDSAGRAVVGFRIPDGTSSTFTIAASVQSWTSVDVYASAGEQGMLVTGPPSTQGGQHTGPVRRLRTVYLVKVAAHDPTHTPVAGYRFAITDAVGTVVVPSVTTGTSPTAAPLGALAVGATYHARELGGPPGGPLYVPVDATTTFVVPPGTTTWTLEAADPEMPTPTIVTRVGLGQTITGQPLVDEVSVTGDDGEDGTIAATLYGPVPAPPSGACSDVTLAEFTASAAHPVTAHVDGAHNGGNGTYPIVGPAASLPGCWGWAETLTLTPSGATATSLPTAANESTLVTTPRVSTTASAQIAAIGAELTDKILVTGMNGQRATMIATLFGPLPGDPHSGCRQYSDAAWQSAIAHSGTALTAGTATIDVTGDGTYVSAPVRLTRAGCYTYRESLTPVSMPGSPVLTPLGTDSESTVVLTPDLQTQAASNEATAGAAIRDRVTVTGTAGVTGSISAQLLGPVPASHGSCAHLDWTRAPVAATLPPVPTSGDGDYETAAVTLRASGCYSFVEALLLGGVPDPFVHTAPGVPSETVLVQPPTATTPPLARTGQPTVVLGGSGLAAIGGGAALILAGRSRRSR